MGTIKVGQPSHLSSEEVYAMVEQRLGMEEITDACAVTIASFWQSPGRVGYAMAQLASTGTVDYEEQKDDIHESRKDAVTYFGGDSPDVAALDMLGTWALSKIREDA